MNYMFKKSITITLWMAFQLAGNTYAQVSANDVGNYQCVDKKAGASYELKIAKNRGVEPMGVDRGVGSMGTDRPMHEENFFFCAILRQAYTGDIPHNGLGLIFCDRQFSFVKITISPITEKTRWIFRVKSGEINQLECKKQINAFEDPTPGSVKVEGKVVALVGIGGEGTGYGIIDERTGDGVEISPANEAIASELNHVRAVGSTVRVYGNYITRQGVERGVYQVLQVTKIVVL